jgi:uncharacterized protein (TIGR03083 family)
VDAQEAIRRAYQDASEWFVSLVEQLAPDCWDQPALGEWTFIELVAHTNRAHTTIGEYLNEPVTSVPPDYFTPESVAARGRASVAALGDDPVAGVRRASSDAVELIGSTSLDTEVGTPQGPLPLGEYLSVRIAELVIHGLDLARAAGIETEPPPASFENAWSFLGRLVLRRGVAAEVLLALSGREQLRSDFTLY